MERVLTSDEMREADSYTINVLKISSETLMNRAGVALADEVETTLNSLNLKSVSVVCGTGNNGGDGYVCATELKNRGFDVKVYAVEGNLTTDCKREKDRYKGVYLRHITGAIVVDCIFGTGLSRSVEGVFAEVINKINSCGAYVISADIPSGLNSDSGLIMGVCVNADKTVAIGELKTGMLLNDGLDRCGEIVKKDIGITCPKDNYALTNFSLNEALFEKRKRNSNKGTYGAACIVAGCEKYPGAAVLSVQGALRSGCGYIKLATCEKLKYAMAVKYPQVIYSEDCALNSQAIAIGMGCGVSKELYQRIKYILENYTGKLLIDADGLNTLAKYGVEILKNKKCEVLITPHIKEFARLTKCSVQDVQNSSIESAKRFASEYKVCIVLKSCSSVICDGYKTFISVKGSSALAKGGSGDMLSGFICGSLARGLGVYDAAVCGVTALGLAAEMSSKEKSDYCATSADILKNLHFSVKYLTDKN